MSRPRSTELRLAEHVDRLGAEHPPIDLASVDYTVRRPDVLNAALRPRPRLHGARRARGRPQRARADDDASRPARGGPPVLRRGVAAAGDPARPDPRRAAGPDRPRQRAPRTSTTCRPRSRSSERSRTSSPIQDVVRMLYYLTGMSTERSAVLAYNLLHNGLTDLGRDRSGHQRSSPRSAARSPATTPSTRCRRAASPSSSPAGSAGWCGTLRTDLVRPGRRQQPAAEGRLRRPDADARASTADLSAFARQISRVERELLWVRDHGMKVPDYVVAAFQEAVDLARSRAG